VLDVPLLVIYFFSGLLTIKKLVTLGICLGFVVHLGNINFAGARPSKQRQPTTSANLTSDTPPPVSHGGTIWSADY